MTDEFEELKELISRLPEALEHSAKIDQAVTSAAQALPVIVQEAVTIEERRRVEPPAEEFPLPAPPQPAAAGTTIEAEAARAQEPRPETVSEEAAPPLRGAAAEPIAQPVDRPPFYPTSEEDDSDKQVSGVQERLLGEIKSVLEEIRDKEAPVGSHGHGEEAGMGRKVDWRDER